MSSTPREEVCFFPKPKSDRFIEVIRDGERANAVFQGMKGSGTTMQEAVTDLLNHLGWDPHTLASWSVRMLLHGYQQNYAIVPPDET